MEKVFPSREPSGEGVPELYTALNGETISFQIACFWDGYSREWGKVEVKSAQGIFVRVRAVQLVPCAYPCHRQADSDYLTTEPGLYPDRLEEIRSQGFPMIPGQWRSLWVDIQAEESVKAGIYPIEISADRKSVV